MTTYSNRQVTARITGCIMAPNKLPTIRRARSKLVVTSREPTVMHDPDAAQAVRQFGAIPPWPAAALAADQVMAALNRHVPEFSSGALTLRDCAIDQLHLKDTSSEWGRNWLLTVADADGERRIPIRVTLFAPNL